MSGTVRRRAIYRGRVQGVGFRAGVHGLAARHPVVGFVRNLPDGTVELVVEGADADIEAFLAAVGERFDGYVTGVEIGPGAGGESFGGFEIRR